MNFGEYEGAIYEFIKKSRMLIKENNPPLPMDMEYDDNAACYEIAASINLLFIKSNYSIRGLAHALSKATTDFLS